MSSIQDIINAATPGPWHRGEFGDVFTSDESGCRKGAVCITSSNSSFFDNWSGNSSFISCFDPEHIALMAEVISCTRNYLNKTYAEPVLHSMLVQAMVELDTYCETHGLSE